MPVSERIEDYLEALFQLETAGSPLTVTAVAEKLKLTKGTVATLVKKMTEQGFATHEAYGKIGLTDAGRKIGWHVAMKHERLTDFFGGLLGLDAEKAEEIACLIEHHLDGAASERFFNLTAFVASRFEQDAAFADDLRKALAETAPLPMPLTLFDGKKGVIKNGAHAGGIVTDIRGDSCKIDGRRITLTPEEKATIWIIPQ